MSTSDLAEIVGADEEPSYDVSSTWATVLGDTIERSFIRRRSLECSSLDINIIGTELTQDHTIYIIQVTSTVKQWVVARRFKDFRYLDKELRKKFPQLNIPVLPPKIYLFSSTDPAVVDERRNQLEVYMKTLSYMPLIWTRNDLVLFLNDESNSMMFMWNFERMRKMQDTLSSMSIENQTETARLTTDLTLAKTQVHALQERLAHMEMVMLQQATGLASEELSSNAIRCLSGVVESDTTKQLHKEITHTTTTTTTDVLDNNHSYPLYNEVIDVFVDKQKQYHQQQRQQSSPVHDLNPLQRSIVEKAFEDHITSGAPMSTSEVVNVLSLTTCDDHTRRKTLQNIETKTPEQVRTVAVSLQLGEALRLSNDILNEKFDITNLTTTTPRDSYDSPSPPSAMKQEELKQQLAHLNSANKNIPIKMSNAEEALFAYSSESHPNSSDNIWMNNLLQEVDELIEVLVPSAESLEDRIKVFRYVRDLVSSALGVQLFPISSLVTQTYLPDSDLDTSAFVIKKDDDSWFVLVNEALCMTSQYESSNAATVKYGSFDSQTSPPGSLSDEDFRISNVSFVNGPVKKIKILINNLTVDISMNQSGTLYSQYLIETLDKFVDKNHLFKRSLLLVEMWCMYESPRYTQGAGSMLRSNSSSSNINEVSSCTDTNRLNTWAVTVMLIWVFNKEGSVISHPIQALGHFLRIYSCFDWSKYTLTVKGPVNAIDLTTTTTNNNNSTSSINLFFPDSLLDTFYVSDDDKHESSVNTSSDNNNNSTINTISTDKNSLETNKHLIMIGEIAIDLRNENDRIITATSTSTTNQNDEIDHSETTKQKPTTTTTTVPLLPSVFAKGMIYERCNETTASCKVHVYQQSIVNILDPVRGNNNLTQHIGVEGYQIITTVMFEGYKHFQLMCESFMKLISTTTTNNNNNVQLLSNQDVMKNMRILFINTLLKIVSWNPNFKKASISIPISLHNNNNYNNNNAGIVVRSEDISIPKPLLGSLQCDIEDLTFSLRYAELVLGGRINRKILERLIIVIIITKGPMPVGEVGKNMQMITGCENFSKKLKEQFSGLKKAIESLESPYIRIGSEHPFNPVVSLINKDNLKKDITTNIFAHSDYVMIPFQAFVALNYDKELNAPINPNILSSPSKKNNNTNNNKKISSYYRSNHQPVGYTGPGSFGDSEDNLSLISQDYASISSNYINSPGKNRNYNGRTITSNNFNNNKQYKYNTKNNYQNQSHSIMNNHHQYSNNNNTILYPSAIPSNQSSQSILLGDGGIGLSPQANNNIQYQQQMQMHYIHQQQLYHQMMLQQQGYLSMSSSLSSSYGGNTNNNNNNNNNNTIITGQMSPIIGGQSPVGPGNGFYYSQSPKNN